MPLMRTANGGLHIFFIGLYSSLRFPVVLVNEVVSASVAFWVFLACPSLADTLFLPSVYSLAPFQMRL